MASQTGREIVNSEVAGSILTVFPVKRKKGIFSRSRTFKTQPPKNNDESNTIIASHSNTEKSHWILGTWYLIGVPDIIWEMCQVLWGRMWWKNEFRRQ